MSGVNLVGLSGRMRSGKDTAAQALIADGWEHMSYAQGLKDYTYALNPIIPDPIGGASFGTYRLKWLVDAIGWERAKDRYPEVRRLLQACGTEAGRGILGQDVWVNAAMSKLPTDRPAVFTDVRFPNEADAIRSRGGLVIRIERPGHDAAPGAHASETAMDHYTFDSIIWNSGTVEHLQETLRRVVR